MLLIAFDMDGTLTKEYSWEDLVKLYGDIKKSHEWMEQYQKGFITYDEWVNNELELFIKNGLRKQDVYDIMTSYKTIEGLEEFLQYINKTYSLFRAIISSGIYERTWILASMLGFNYYVGAEFEYAKDGRVKGMRNIMYPEDKKKHLKFLMDIYKPSKVVVIGDSTFDVPMMELADIKISINNTIDGCGVDYHAKDYFELIDVFDSLLRKNIL